MFVMASQRNEGAAIQLKFQMDGHVAALLAMTNGFNAALTQSVAPLLSR